MMLEEIKFDIVPLLDWFEKHYYPGQIEPTNGKKKAAEMTMKGIRGNIVIRMMYEQDLYPKEVSI